MFVFCLHSSTNSISGHMYFKSFFFHIFWVTCFYNFSNIYIFLVPGYLNNSDLWIFFSFKKAHIERIVPPTVAFFVNLLWQKMKRVGKNIIRYASMASSMKRKTSQSSSQGQTKCLVVKLVQQQSIFFYYYDYFLGILKSAST